MSLQKFNDILIDLDEVRMIHGGVVVFKGDQKMYDIGAEAADAVRGAFTPTSPDPNGIVS